MSAQGPSNPLGDRPRMAEALASLKEGLRDTADPLYDSWKLRPRGPAGANAEVRPPDFGKRPLPDVHPPPIAKKPAEARIPEAPKKPAEARAPDLAKKAAGAPRGTEDGKAAAASAPSDMFAETIEVSFDASIEESELSSVDIRKAQEPLPAPRSALEAGDRPSAQGDTVRVRVIRYKTFPRWAIVSAAAFIVFAGSLLALRVGFLGDSAQPSQSVLSSEVAAEVEPEPIGVATAPPDFPDPDDIPPPPVEAVEPSGVDPFAAEAPSREPQLLPPSPMQPPPAPAKIQSPPTRRRSNAAHDFFRDPGF